MLNLLTDAIIKNKVSPIASLVAGHDVNKIAEDLCSGAFWYLIIETKFQFNSRTPFLLIREAEIPVTRDRLNKI